MRTVEECQRRVSEAQLKLQAKLGEVAASEGALREIERVHQLAPMSRDIERAYRGHQAQVQRRVRKAHRYAIELLEVQQEQEDVQRADQEERRRQTEAARVEFLQQVQGLAADLAREGCLDRLLSLPSGHRPVLLFNYGPSAYRACEELAGLLEQHARDTGRGALVGANGVSGCYGEPDFRLLLAWAMNQNGSDPADNVEPSMPVEEDLDDDYDQVPEAEASDADLVTEEEVPTNG